jgi:hypothetical protein
LPYWCGVAARYEDGKIEIEGLEGPGARVPKGGRVWRTRPDIKHVALAIGGTCRIAPADRSGGLWDAGEDLVEGLGRLTPDMHKGGAVNYC